MSEVILSNYLISREERKDIQLEFGKIIGL